MKVAGKTLLITPNSPGKHQRAIILASLASAADARFGIGIIALCVARASGINWFNCYELVYGQVASQK